MTTPAGGDRPAGFSSPMGGFSARTATAAAAAALSAMAASAALYKRHMEDAAKAAEKVTAETKKQADLARSLAARATAAGPPPGFPPVAGGSSGNGGGASMPPPPPTAQPVVVGPVTPNGSRRIPSPNGGGAVIPPSPGRPQLPQLPASMQPGPATAAMPNGGGASFGMGGALAAGGLRAAGVVGGLGLAAAASAFPNMVQTDYAANRLAMTNGRGGYNQQATANRMLGYTAGAYINDQDRVAGLMQLRNGGFMENSTGFGTQAQSARAIGRLDPTRGFARSAAVQTGFQDPGLFNMTRMLTGVETIGRGGAPQSIGQVAQGIARSGWGTSTPPSAQALQASLGPAGQLRHQMTSAGMDQDMQASIADYLRVASETGSYAAADRQLNRPGNRLTGNNADTALQRQNSQTSAEQEVITALLKPTMDAYAKIMSATTKATEDLAKLLRALPDVITDAMGAAIAGTGAVKGELGGGGVNSMLAGALGGALFGAAGGRGGSGRLGRAVARGAGRAGGAAGRGLGRTAARIGLRGIPVVGAVATGAELAYQGIDGIAHADRSEGMFSGRAWQTAWEHGVGGQFGYRAPRESGDGLGTRPNFGMAGWGGISRPEVGDGERGAGESGGGGGRGGSTIDFIKKLMNQSGLPHRITSTLRPGAVTTSGKSSFHSSGHAVDIAGSRPGRDTREMLNINQYLARKLGRGAKELIYSGPGATNLYDGRPHTFSPRVRSIHHDHVHVAVTADSLKRVGLAAGHATGQNEENEVRREKAIAREQRGKRTRRAPGALRRGRQGRSGTPFSERELIANFFSGIGVDDAPPASSVDPTEGDAASDAKTASARAVTPGGTNASAGPGAVDKFLQGLRMVESDGIYTAENPNSSASGAYQYLTGTWAKYKGYSTAGSAPPAIQDERARADSARRYAKYGDWRKVAVAHFRGEGWLQNNPDPSTWANGSTGGQMSPMAYAKKVLTSGGLPETGDGIGGSSGMGAYAGTADSVLADVPAPRSHQRGGSGRGGVAVDARRGGINIAKVEVHLTTPQVSPQEAQRIGKMIVADIARQARQSEMSR